MSKQKQPLQIHVRKMMVKIQPLTEELSKKVASKWPKRYLMNAAFGHPQVLEDKSFIIVNSQYVFRTFPSKVISDHDTLFIHSDVFNTIEDKSEIKISVIDTSLQPCSALLVDCDDVIISDPVLTFIHQSLLNHPVFDGSLHVVNFYGKIVKFRVNLKSADAVIIDDLAQLNLKTSTPMRQKQVVKLVTEKTHVQALKTSTCSAPKAFKIGGMDKEMATIQEAVSVVDQGLKAYAGILIYGSSGVGKTSLAQAFMSRKSEYHCVTINASDIFSQFAGETEQKLRQIIDAEQGRKSIIFIDEFDVLASSDRGQGKNTEQERRVSACLKTLMDELADDDSGSTIFLAASCRPDSIDSAFRRPGRLGLEIEICAPDAKQRLGICQSILEKSNFDMTDENIEYLARNAHGYVAADLEAVIHQASLDSDLVKALKLVQPSAMREVQVQVPNVTWADIGGLDDLKLKLKQAVEWPIKRPEVFSKMGITPPKGVLMYGPPGCSKTMIAKALANESHLNFVAIKGPELFKKYVGESEQAVRQLFKRARRVSPCILFFDEIDALGSERSTNSGSSKVGDRVLAQLLTEMDGIEQLKDVVIVAATNRPDMIDKALMRPGRLDRVVYVPLPDRPTRLKIFQIHTRNKPLDSSVDLSKLAEETSGYSGAEIAAICNEAALAALQEAIQADLVEDKINVSHFEIALQSIKPRLDLKLLSIYDQFQNK